MQDDPRDAGLGPCSSGEPAVSTNAAETPAVDAPAVALGVRAGPAAACGSIAPAPAARAENGAAWGDWQLDAGERDQWAGWDLVHRDWSERAACVRARSDFIASAYAEMRRRVRWLCTRARPPAG